jgi:hypothetical protein
MISRLETLPALSFKLNRFDLIKYDQLSEWIFDPIKI